MAFSTPGNTNQDKPGSVSETSEVPPSAVKKGVNVFPRSSKDASM